MPTYEYLCETNGRVLEVQHKMAEKLASWGEVCERAGIEPGTTPVNAPVTKLMSSAFVSGGSSAMPMPACGAGACGTGPCGSGMCEM